MKKWKIVGLVLCLLVLVLVLNLIRKQIPYRGAVEEHRQAGYPVTIGDFREWYESPEPSENARSVFMEWEEPFWELEPEWDDYLIEEFFERDVETEQSLGLRRDIPQETLEELGTRLDGQKEYLAQTEHALSLPHFYVDIRSSEDLIELSSFSLFRQTARVFNGRALHQAVTGDIDGAVHSIGGMMAIGTHLNDVPLVKYSLVAGSIYPMGIDAMDWLIQSFELSDKQLRELATQLDVAEKSIQPTRYAIGDIVNQLAFLDAPTDYAVVNWLARVCGSVSTFEDEELNEAMDYDKRAGWLRDARDWILSLENDPFGTLHRDHLELRRSDGSKPLFFDIRSTRRAVSACGDTIGRLRSARLGIHIERYRLKHGELPSKLSDLVPEFIPEPIDDPFKKEAYEYEILADGFRVGNKEGFQSIDENKRVYGGISFEIRYRR